MQRAWVRQSQLYHSLRLAGRLLRVLPLGFHGFVLLGYGPTCGCRIACEVQVWDCKTKHLLLTPTAGMLVLVRVNRMNATACEPVTKMLRVRCKCDQQWRRLLAPCARASSRLVESSPPDPMVKASDALSNPFPFRSSFAHRAGCFSPSILPTSADVHAAASSAAARHAPHTK
jgi:hypothetical protein